MEGVTAGVRGLRVWVFAFERGGGRLVCFWPPRRVDNAPVVRRVLLLRRDARNADIWVEPKRRPTRGAVVDGGGGGGAAEALETLTFVFEGARGMVLRVCNIPPEMFRMLSFVSSFFFVFALTGTSIARVVFLRLAVHGGVMLDQCNARPPSPANQMQGGFLRAILVRLVLLEI